MMGTYSRHHPIGPCVSYAVIRPKLEDECVMKALEKKEIVLTGPRGNGKTQLARRIARKIAHVIHGIHDDSVREVHGGCEELNALHEECVRGNNASDCKIVIIDGVTQSALPILTDLQMQRPPQWIFIITTLNENLDCNCIEVQHLSEPEFRSLVRNLSKNSHVIPENLVKEFYEVLDGNPLELVYAVGYLINTKKTPEDYLKCLLKGDACTLPNDSTAFKANEYPSSLQTALAGDIHKIVKNVEHCPQVVEALQALAFFHNENIPIEAFSAVFPGKKPDVTDALIEQVRTYSLGKVTYDEKERRFLTLNKAFQRALFSFSEMDDQRKQQSVELACRVLVHVCHKDNRDKADYKAQVDVERHVKSVLDLALPRKSVGATILKVWFLSSLGHNYIQTEQISKGESTLEKAMKIIEKDLLQGELKLLEIAKTDLENFFEITQELSHTEEAKIAMKEFIQSLRISSSDQLKWCSRSSELHKHFDNKVASLTPELYDKLVENDCAIDIDRVVPYFLAEVVATVLYSYGRIFLYNQRDKARKQKALEVSKMICQSIEKIYNVRLLHTELVDRNGLLCFKLKTAEGEMKPQGMMQKDAEDAISGYEEKLRSSCDRYEYGLLKSVRLEQYQKMVCLRYELKAHRILWKIRRHDSDVRSKILDCIRQLDEITSDKDSQTINLQRNTSVQTEIASTLLLFEDEEHLENAKKRFLHVCDAEKKCRKINYPWMEALEGLVTLTNKLCYRDKQKAVAIAKQAKTKLKTYIKRCDDEENLDNARSGNILLNKVKIFLFAMKDHGKDSIRRAGPHSISPNCFVLEPDPEA